MNNELVKTDSFLYKIKMFFKKIFKTNKTEIITQENNVQEEKQKNIAFEDTLLKTEIQEQNRKSLLAKNLLEGELNSSDLTDEETEEMIEYFKDDIQKIDNEILKIKAHILDMKRQMLKESGQ